MEAIIHTSSCSLNLLGTFSMRQETKGHFHIKVPLLGFKSWITRVTLGKVKEGNSLTQTTLPQWAVFTVMENTAWTWKQVLSERKKTKKRRCKLGRLDAGRFSFSRACAVFIYSFITRATEQRRNLHLVHKAAGWFVTRPRHFTA